MYKTSRDVGAYQGNLPKKQEIMSFIEKENKRSPVLFRTLKLSNLHYIHTLSLSYSLTHSLIRTRHSLKVTKTSSAASEHIW